VVIGNDSADGHSTVVALPLEREKGDNCAFVANNCNLNVGAHRSHRLDEFRRKQRVAQLGVGFLEISPGGEVMRAQSIARHHFNVA
jgi:hypothetical protein